MHGAARRQCICVTVDTIRARTVSEEEQQAGWQYAEGREERQRLGAGGRHHDCVFQVLQDRLQAPTADERQSTACQVPRNKTKELLMSRCYTIAIFHDDHVIATDQLGQGGVGGRATGAPG